MKSSSIFIVMLLTVAAPGYGSMPNPFVKGDAQPPPVVTTPGPTLPGSPGGSAPLQPPKSLPAPAYLPDSRPTPVHNVDAPKSPRTTSWKIIGKMDSSIILQNTEKLIRLVDDHTRIDECLVSYPEIDCVSEISKPKSGTITNSGINSTHLKAQPNSSTISGNAVESKNSGLQLLETPQKFPKWVKSTAFEKQYSRGIGVVLVATSNDTQYIAIPEVSASSLKLKHTRTETLSGWSFFEL